MTFIRPTIGEPGAVTGVFPRGNPVYVNPPAALTGPNARRATTEAGVIGAGSPSFGTRPT